MNGNKNKKRKKGFIYILISLLIIAIFWSLIFLFEFLFDYYASNVLYGYYKEERFIQQVGFQGYDEYYKYYYTEKEDTNFFSRYYKVTNENIETIKLFRDDFKEIMVALNKLDKYDFYNIDIEESDYYLLFCEDLENPYTYDLYYYDTETHILYKLHVS